MSIRLCAYRRAAAQIAADGVERAAHVEARTISFPPVIAACPSDLDATGERSQTTFLALGATVIQTAAGDLPRGATLFRTRAAPSIAASLLDPVVFTAAGVAAPFTTLTVATFLPLIAADTATAAGLADALAINADFGVRTLVSAATTVVRVR